MRTALLASLSVLIVGCGAPELEREWVLEPVAFDDMPGWRDEEPRDALAAFLRSCEAIDGLPDDRRLSPSGVGGVAADWRLPCAEARLALARGVDAAGFFESRFAAFRVDDRVREEGLLTGYYEPLLHGSLTPDERYNEPLYGVPDDLVMIELAEFDPSLPDRTLRGRVDGRRLTPYPERSAIDGGHLEGRGLEIVWVDDPIDSFFLHIQGSGRVELDDGRIMRIGYAEQNGQPYRAIGRDLIALGELEPEEVSMQSIRRWLEDNPARARAIMHNNLSYIFFRDLGVVPEDQGPVGAQGVPLTAGRSLAVDDEIWPYGLPVYVDTRVPYPDGARDLQRLLIAQDTGGALEGAARGDLFWGAGALAEHVAGHMKSEADFYILLPGGLAPAS